MAKSLRKVNLAVVLEKGKLRPREQSMNPAPYSGVCAGQFIPGADSGASAQPQKLRVRVNNIS